MITSRQVEAFRAVMVTRSMTEAASLLNVTQSAVSKILKEMEEEIAFPLFSRRQGGLLPTWQADLLFREVERSYIGIDRIFRAATLIRERHHGQIRIAANSALSSGFLPGVIREFSTNNPMVQVSLETYNSPEVVELLLSGQFDLGYAMPPVSDANITVSAVYHRRCVCLLPNGHPLAAQDRIDIRQIDQHPFISLVGGNPTRLRIDGLFTSLNVSRKIVIETNHSLSVGLFVSEGLGLSIVDPFTATLASRLSCQVRELVQDVDFSFAALRPKSAATNSMSAAFTALLEARLEEIA